jgi:hypothetical protein
VSGVEGTADGAKAWREQLAQTGTRLLDLLKERPRPNAEWEVRAHGALVDVETKNDDLFDRVVLVVQRDAHQTPDDFRVSVEGRLDRLDRYLQSTNSGRVVRRLMLENLCGVSVMRRRGPDPSTVGISWPPFSALPLLVARVARDVGVYVRLTGDEDLRFLGALRLCEIPGKDEARDWRLTFDAMDTIIGRREETTPLTPMTLMRGVLDEVVTLGELRLMDPQGFEAPLSKTDRRSAETLIASMRAASQWSQRSSCTPKKLAQRLVELRPVEQPQPRRGRAGLFAVLLFLVLLSAVGVYRFLG